MAWGKRTSLPSYSARCLTESYPHFPSKAPTLPRIQTSQWNHFAYTGLVHCGCLFVGELKKRKYLYYHCTGNRGKCPEPTRDKKSSPASSSTFYRSWSFRSRYWIGSATLFLNLTERNKLLVNKPSNGCMSSTSASP